MMEAPLRTCPDCGLPDATWLQDIRYPSGSVTAVLDCPHCARVVLEEQLPLAN